MNDSLGDRIAARLLADIVAGTYPPDAPLPPEVELAERVGASRLTVRDAIRILRHQGVVRVVRGRGTYVLPRERWSPLDPLVLAALAGTPDGVGGQMTALLEARALVEVGAAELAAARRDDADLRAMAEAIQAMRRAGDDLEAFVDADIAFHDAVLSAAGNAVLAALFEPIARLLHDSRVRTSRNFFARGHAIAAHERIRTAIERRSPVQAAWAMRDHLNQTGEDYAAERTRDRGQRAL
jgi:GntR family transcriptional repressor for pyruvate dehydrogenase complex